MADVERSVSCSKVCTENCPHVNTAEMKAICDISPETVELRPGEPVYDMTPHYRAAESLCENCTEYTPETIV